MHIGDQMMRQARITYPQPRLLAKESFAVVEKQVDHFFAGVCEQVIITAHKDRVFLNYIQGQRAQSVKERRPPESYRNSC
jgi:hypothetical protein